MDLPLFVAKQEWEGVHTVGSIESSFHVFSGCSNSGVKTCRRVFFAVFYQSTDRQEIARPLFDDLGLAYSHVKGAEVCVPGSDNRTNSGHA